MSVVGVWYPITGTPDPAASHTSDVTAGLEWKIVSQNIANNQSTIQLRQYIKKGTSNSPYNLDTQTSYYKHDGGNLLNVSTKYDTRGASDNEVIYIGTAIVNQKGFTGTTRQITVTHTSDGTRSLRLQAKIATNNDYNAENIYVDETVTLPTIPREATLTSVPNFNIGTDPVVTIDNPGSLYVRIEGENHLTNQVISKQGYLTKLAVLYPNDAMIYSAIPNSNQETITLRIFTYTDSSQSDLVGSYHEYTTTAFVVDSDPIFTNFSWQDVDSEVPNLTDSDQKLVSGYSDVKTIISSLNKAVAQNYATMDHYLVTIGSKQVTIAYGTGDVYGTIINAIPVNGLISVVAVDSRGNQTTALKTATVLTLTPISITGLTAQRDNMIDEEVSISLTGKVHLLNFGSVTNSVKVKYYKYKKTDSSTWITGTTTLSISVDGSGNIAISNLYIIGDTAAGFEKYESYDILVGFSDELSSITFTQELQGQPTLMAVRYLNEAIVSIGGVPNITEQGLQNFGKYFNKFGNPVAQDIWSFSELGLSDGCSVENICAAMPDYSVARLYHASGTTTDSTIGGYWGTLIIEKIVDYRCVLRFYSSDYYSNLTDVFIIGTYYNGSLALVDKTSQIGTYTPFLYGTTTAGSFTYATQYGYYVREGNLVYVEGEINISAVGTAPTGEYRIGGLPFAGAKYHMPIPCDRSQGTDEDFRKVSSLSIVGGTQTGRITAFSSNGNAEHLTNSTTPITTGTYSIYIPFAGTYRIG